MHGGLLGLKTGHPEGHKLPLTRDLQVTFAKKPAEPNPVITEAVPSAKTEDLPTASPPAKGKLPNVPVESPKYYLSSEVDVRAAPLKMQALIYPAEAFQLRLYGVVKLRVFINENGGIDAVNVIEANPPGVFDSAAVAAMVTSKFSPAEKNGHSVKNQKLIEIKFDPYENIAGSSQGQ